MTKDSKLNLTTKQAKYCIGYCRMTLRAETVDNEAFVKVQFVELLELIARAAVSKFHNTEHELLPLADKCILVLDLILPYFGSTRKDVKAKEDSASESDEDY